MTIKEFFRMLARRASRFRVRQISQPEKDRKLFTVQGTGESRLSAFHDCKAELDKAMRAAGYTGFDLYQPLSTVQDQVTGQWTHRGSRMGVKK